jgi:polyvinyl alcohol dehydrogenase (cytochrome)
LWKTYVIPEAPKPSAGAAIAAAPTIDAKRNLLYVGTGGSLIQVSDKQTDAVLALDLTDGQVRWTRQFARHDETGGADFASSPILRTLSDGRQVVLAGQKSGIVYALDPDHGGELLWQTKVSEAREWVGCHGGHRHEEWDTALVHPGTGAGMRLGRAGLLACRRPSSHGHSRSRVFRLDGRAS